MELQIYNKGENTMKNKKNTYAVVMVCNNCDAVSTILVPKGILVANSANGAGDAKCKNCGCVGTLYKED